MKAPFAFPRVQVVPGLDEASFLVDGAERAVYRFGTGLPRPFLFPVLGPSGARLTRMGHPNPVGHEHHRSVWFGHQKVDGVNFWEEREGSEARVRHRRVVLYHDASDFAGLVAELEWQAGERTLLKQRLIVALEPLPRGDYALDFESHFETAGKPVELGQTNFGFLGVRVAKTLSEQFGGGTLRNDRGDSGEPAIFGKPARWVDYSGPSRPGVEEGICYMDHPSNPNHPTSWHVRQDGWMEAAFNLRGPYGVATDHPLDQRYRLFVHAGRLPVSALQTAWEHYAETPPLEVLPGRGGALASLVRRAAR